MNAACPALDLDLGVTLPVTLPKPTYAAVSRVEELVERAGFAAWLFVGASSDLSRRVPAQNDKKSDK